MSDFSDIVVVSSEEDTGGSDQSAADVAAGNAVSVDDESESDCEIVSIDDVQEEKWRDVRGPFKRLNALLRAGHNDPRMLLIRLFGIEESCLPNDPLQLWGLLLTLLAEPTPRRRLRRINTLEKVIELLTSCRSILVVTGAGISVSCGIPDFRSRDGVYARLSKDYPDLSSPQAMFDMAYFVQNPSPFFKFAKEIFPGQFTPSLTHRFVALLEIKNKLLRNYTQNIDTLEQAAGITRLIQCHGSFASATCTSCKYRVPGDQIKDDIFAQKIPYCPRCRPKGAHQAANSANGTWSPQSSSDKNSAINATDDNLDSSQLSRNSAEASFGVLKPDIVFFGEDLSSEFHNTLASDVKEADLVLVMGSSLKVRPVSHIPNSIPGHVPQILINREPLSNHDFDVELLGDCDVIVSELCTRLGWLLDDSLGPSPSEPGTLIPLRELWENRMKMIENGEKENTRPNTAGASEEGAGEVLKDYIISEQKAIKSSFQVPTDITSNSGVISKDTEAPNGSDSESAKNVVEIKGSDDESEEEDAWEVAASLPLGSFTRIPPNQYVFSGAEVYISQNEDMSMILSSNENSCSPEKCEDADDVDSDEEKEDEGDDDNDGTRPRDKTDKVSGLGSTASEKAKRLSLTVRTDEAGDHILERMLNYPSPDAVSHGRATLCAHIRSPRFHSSSSGKHTRSDEPRTPPPTPRHPDPENSVPLASVSSPLNIIDHISEQASDSPKTLPCVLSTLDGPDPKRPRSDEDSVAD